MTEHVISIDEFIANQPIYNRRRPWITRIGKIALFPFVKFTASGVENIPSSGPTIIMMNHIGFLDPVACVFMSPDRWVIPMSKIENMNNAFFRWVINQYGAYTIDRDRLDRTGLNNSIALMRSGELILIAPEGTRQKHGLVEPKDGMAYVAAKAEAMIVPTAVIGSDKFGSELKRLRRAHVHVAFGKPFQFKTEGRKRIPRDELSRMMQEAMYQLAATIPDEHTELRGVYKDLGNSTTEMLTFPNLSG